MNFFSIYERLLRKMLHYPLNEDAETFVHTRVIPYVCSRYGIQESLLCPYIEVSDDLRRIVYGKVCQKLGLHVQNERVTSVRARVLDVAHPCSALRRSPSLITSYSITNATPPLHMWRSLLLRDFYPNDQQSIVLQSLPFPSVVSIMLLKSAQSTSFTANLNLALSARSLSPTMAPDDRVFPDWCVDHVQALPTTTASEIAYKLQALYLLITYFKSRPHESTRLMAVEEMCNGLAKQFESTLNHTSQQFGNSDIQDIVATLRLSFALSVMQDDKVRGKQLLKECVATATNDIENVEKVAEYYCSLACVAADHGELDVSEEYFTLAYELYATTLHSMEKALTVKHNTGAVMFRSRDKQKWARALVIFEEMLKVYQTQPKSSANPTNFKFEIARTLSSIGSVYYRMGKTKIALTKFNDALQIAEFAVFVLASAESTELVQEKQRQLDDVIHSIQRSRDLCDNRRRIEATAVIVYWLRKQKIRSSAYVVQRNQLKHMEDTETYVRAGLEIVNTLRSCSMKLVFSEKMELFSRVLLHARAMRSVVCLSETIHREIVIREISYEFFIAFYQALYRWICVLNESEGWKAILMAAAEHRRIVVQRLELNQRSTIHIVYVESFPRNLIKAEEALQHVVLCGLEDKEQYGRLSVTYLASICDLSKQLRSVLKSEKQRRENVEGTEATEREKITHQQSQTKSFVPYALAPHSRNYILMKDIGTVLDSMARAVVEHEPENPLQFMLMWVMKKRMEYAV
eukprot:PhF_6_TR8757/c0_g1_i1/m.13810